MTMFLMLVSLFLPILINKPKLLEMAMLSLPPEKSLAMQPISEPSKELILK